VSCSGSGVGAVESASATWSDPWQSKASLACLLSRYAAGAGLWHFFCLLAC
jgi:hypothetical protein